MILSISLFIQFWYSHCPSKQSQGCHGCQIIGKIVQNYSLFAEFATMPSSKWPFWDWRNIFHQLQLMLRFGIKDTTFEFGHFRIILGHFFAHYLQKYLSQNLIADGHFEVLNRSTSWLDQKLQHKTQIFLFLLFSTLEEKILKIYDS